MVVASRRSRSFPYMMVREGSSMTDGQGDAVVTIDEEIRCLLEAGWAWDGDKLVHPTEKAIWGMYQRVDCRSITARAKQFESEIMEAASRARRQGRPPGSGAPPSASGGV